MLEGNTKKKGDSWGQLHIRTAKIIRLRQMGSVYEVGT